MGQFDVVDVLLENGNLLTANAIAKKMNKKLKSVQHMLRRARHCQLIKVDMRPFRPVYSVRIKGR